MRHEGRAAGKGLVGIWAVKLSDTGQWVLERACGHSQIPFLDRGLCTQGAPQIPGTCSPRRRVEAGGLKVDVSSY